VRVHVESDGQAVELRVMDDGIVEDKATRRSPTYTAHYLYWVYHYRTLCTTPCNMLVETRAPWRRFYFEAEGVTRSEVFDLDARSPRVSMRVSPGNAAARTAGAWLAGFGGGAAVGAAGIFAYGLLTGDESRSLRTVGGGLLAAGLGTLVLGLALHLPNTTRVAFLR
jgi:hypothetical protein